MNRTTLSAFGAALLILLPSIAAADTAEVSGGGQLTGKVERNADYTVVTVDDEIQVAVRASRVRRVVTADQLKTYRDMVTKVGNDAELHYQLAIWCVSKKNGTSSEKNVPGDAQQYKRYHMRRAIAIDPDHAKARASLGYKKHEGKWMLTSEIMRNRGMITKGGRWELPEAVALEEAQDATNVDAKKWIREVARLTKVALKNPASARDSKKAREALDALKGIKDPLATSAIAKQLKDSREKGTQSRALRMLWVKLLGKFRNSTSVKALVLAGMEEDDVTIREVALDELAEYGSSSAVATYVPMLKSNDNKIVNRAARALTWFPDPELALTYVDALVTEHKRIVPPGPGMNVGTGSGGGNQSSGIAMGGKAKVIKRKMTNPSALSLVKTIEPDVDFGYDEQAWKQHFASKRTAFTGDLRRDP